MIAGFCLVVVVFCLLLNLRIRIVGGARLRMIKQNHALFNAMPSYAAAMLRPKYWLLWTEAHWRAWAARQQNARTS